MKVIILRGISGAGKSTYARHLQENCGEVLICSADEFMETARGYKFNGRALEDAHKYCLRRFIDAVQKRWETIVLDNTNVLFHKFSHYVTIAEAYDYEVEIITITVDPEVAAERTQHDVPLKSLRSKSKALKDDLARVDIPLRIRQRTVCAGSPTWQRWGQ